MDTVQDKLKKLKDDFFSLNLESKTEEGVSIANIMKIDDVSMELKEALILLTNNYTAELQAIRNHQVRSLIKIIDTDLELLEKLRSALKDLEEIKQERSESLFSYNNIKRYLMLGGGVILFLTILYHIEPTAVDKALEGIKNIFSYGIKAANAISNLI